MRDPYEVLGLKRSASEAEIKKAYRKLAKESHPDRHAGDPKAQARFAEISAANEILSDKEKRGKFDRGEIDAEGKPRFQGFEGFAGQGGPGGPGHGRGFENIDPSAFADLFAGMNRGGGGAGGRTRSFRFSTGPGGPGGQGGQGGARGFDPGGDPEDDLLGSILGGLGGRGRRGAAPSPGADIRADVAVTLEDLAAGKKPKVALPSGKTVALTLPKGVTDGQVIRLQGQGQSSMTGGPPGDALVTIRFVPHPLFKVEGADLRLDLPVSLDEAVLGAKIPVPTLSGKVQVTLPPYSSSGRTLRLKGKGLPTEHGHGDLLVSPRIVLPETKDPDLESLMRRWRDEGRQTPRGPAFD
jgi:DnaJ-class molecular chaperone